MIELEIHVVQMVVNLLLMSNLVKLAWDVALLLKVFRSDLSDMHVNHVGIVTVNLHHLVLVIAIDIDIVARRDVLMWQDHLRLSVLIARCFHVPNL